VTTHLVVILKRVFHFN